MPTVWVRLDDRRSYPIVIRAGVLADLGRLVRQRNAGRTACLVTHPRLNRLYGRAAARSLVAAGFRAPTLLVPEGETSKSLKHSERLVGELLRLGVDRGDCLVALGGGVVGDLAGWVAGIYLRGIDFIQVPTSLLAQVDSAVGGKVAVNHALGKNLIGVFHQPRLVVSDPKVLRTLPPRQFRAGLAEIIKIAAVADRNFFARLERDLPRLLARRTEVLTPIIRRACELKAAVVQADERESGLRMILNYGHTLGHALEAYHGYRGYLHGEAIAVGMAVAARLAAGLGLCTPQTAQRQVRLLKAAGLPVSGRGESFEKLWKIIKTDKKVRKGLLNFVLTPQIGHARICCNLTPFSVRRAWHDVVAGIAAEDWTHG